MIKNANFALFLRLINARQKKRIATICIFLSKIFTKPLLKGMFFGLILGQYLTNRVPSLLSPNPYKENIALSF